MANGHSAIRIRPFSYGCGCGAASFHNSMKTDVSFPRNSDRGIRLFSPESDPKLVTLAE